MATYTSHYNLKKPATSDKIRIADFNGNADTIDSTMYDNATLIGKLKADIGIVENTNTATHNISSGQYVIWKGSLYTASSAISSGATLSSANLTAVTGGGLNSLIDQVTNPIKTKTSTITSNASGYIVFPQNEFVLMAMYGNYNPLIVFRNPNTTYHMARGYHTHQNTTQVNFDASTDYSITYWYI